MHTHSYGVWYGDLSLSRCVCAMLRAIKVNDRFDVMGILTAHVLPELQAPDVNALPVIKADAVKFATTFRNQLSREQPVQIPQSPVFQIERSAFHSPYGIDAHACGVLCDVSTGCRRSRRCSCGS